MGAHGNIILRKPIETPDVQYRKLDALNYSSIVKFEKSPVLFYEEFILGNKPEDEDTPATLLGTIVDDVILSYQGDLEAFEQNFEENYALYDGEPSTAQGFILADLLFTITKQCIVDGEISREFKDRFHEAFNIIQEQGKYKGKTVEQGLEDFNKPNKAGNSPKSYFETKLANIGKKVVSVGIKLKGLQIASNAFTDPFTKDLFSFHGKDENIELLTKFPITFTYKGENGEIEGKIEVDMLEINHLAKTIQPFDLKTTYDNTQFPYGYLKNRYYIQGGWYTEGIENWKTENNMGDYTVLPYKFIVLDTSNNNRRPIIYELEKSHTTQAYIGFYVGNHYYKGINQLVEAIIWGNQQGIWNCSKEVYENEGKIKLENYI
jgi:hypothetical protein